jgi:hypothetical protein
MDNFPPKITFALTVLIAVLALPFSVSAQILLPTMSEMAKPPPSTETNIQSEDPVYKKGSDIYFGRKGYKKYKYCLAVVKKNNKFVAKTKLPVSARVPLSRKSIRAFRRSGLLMFVNAVFDCDAPTKLIFKQLKTEDVRFLLYYLDKKYKLKLKN